MVGQAEIVVGAKIQDLPASGDRDAGALRRRDDALAFVQTGGLDVGEGPAQILLVPRRHVDSQLSTILPLWPERMRSKASWNSVKGKRWVMTGVISSPR